MQISCHWMQMSSLVKEGMWFALARHAGAITHAAVYANQIKTPFANVYLYSFSASFPYT